MIPSLIEIEIFSKLSHLGGLGRKWLRAVASDGKIIPPHSMETGLKVIRWEVLVLGLKTTIIHESHIHKTLHLLISWYLCWNSASYGSIM